MALAPSPAWWQRAAHKDRAPSPPSCAATLSGILHPVHSVVQQPTSGVWHLTGWSCAAQTRHA